MNTEDEEFRRIEAEIKRREDDDDDTQGYFSESPLPQIKEFLNELNDRIARRYRGGQKDQDIAYGMEIVYFDLIDLIEGKK